MSQAHDPCARARALARLARLEVADERLPALEEHLERILGWVAQLERVEVEGVDPSLHAEVWASSELRPDEVRPSLPRELALRNGPRCDALGFLVPRVVSE